jgi:hypothetical protein
MSRRPAIITQADIARTIRAAKQAGADRVEVCVGDKAMIMIRLKPSTDEESALESVGEIIL